MIRESTGESFPRILLICNLLFLVFIDRHLPWFGRCMKGILLSNILRLGLLFKESKVTVASHCQLKLPCSIIKGFSYPSWSSATVASSIFDLSFKNITLSPFLVISKMNSSFATKVYLVFSMLKLACPTLYRIGLSSSLSVGSLLESESTIDDYGRFSLWLSFISDSGASE